MNDLRGVVDQTDANGTEFYTLQNYGEMFANPSPTLHHKYGIIDASYPDSDPVVITGSHNWSSAAENDNDENTLIIHDPYIANQYMQEFKRDIMMQAVRVFLLYHLLFLLNLFHLMLLLKTEL